MVYSAPADREPTADFDAYCREIVQRWEVGEIPFKEAVAAITQKEQEAVSTQHLANQGRAHHILGFLQHYRGNLDASIRHYERAKTLFQQVDNPRRVAIMDMNNGENYRMKGDFTRARRLYRTAYETAAQLNEVETQSMAAANEGLVLLAIGQYSNARKMLLEGLELSKLWKDRLDQREALLTEIYQALAMIYLDSGDLDLAWEEAKHALHAAKRSGEMMHMAFAYRVLAEVITAFGHAPEGEFLSDPDEYFRLAMDAFREMNMEAEMARTIFAQARSLAKRGRRTTAARKLQQVMIMFTELGMVDDTAKAAEAQLSLI